MCCYLVIKTYESLTIIENWIFLRVVRVGLVVSSLCGVSGVPSMTASIGRQYRQEPILNYGEYAGIIFFPLGQLDRG